VDDLRLEGDVERRGRLVRDQQVGTGDQGERDADALAHAARELMRVPVNPALGTGMPTRRSMAIARCRFSARVACTRYWTSTA
jgi:hypothetical protein